MGGRRGYPKVYEEIFRLVKDSVLETKTARAIMRKSGFRPTSASGGAAGGSVLTLPPCAYTAEGAAPAGFLARYAAQDTAFAGVFKASALVVSMEGEVWVRGSNTHGQFGLGDNFVRTDWVPVPDLPPIQSVTYLNNSVFFLTEEGQVYAAGSNNLGQLGIGTTSDVYTPVLLDIAEPIVAVEGTDQATLHALTDSNTVYSWGAGWAGQLGDGRAEPLPDDYYFDAPFPNTSLGDDVAQIACGRSWTLLRRTDGSVDGFGYIGLGPGEASFIEPSAYSLEGYYAVVTPTELPLGTPDCIDISAGGYGALYVFSDGTAKISDVFESSWEQWTHSTPKIADFYPGTPDFPDEGYGVPTFYGTVEGVSTALRGWTRESGGGHALELVGGSLYSFGRNDRFDIGDGTDTATVGLLKDMYKVGTTSLVENPVSFSGVTTFAGSSVLGAYYVVNADGTLIYWSNDLPTAINSEIG